MVLSGVWKANLGFFFSGNVSKVILVGLVVESKFGNRLWLSLSLDLAKPNNITLNYF